jgi:hyperosmotically inducible periplasmic protein
LKKKDGFMKTNQRIDFLLVLGMSLGSMAIAQTGADNSQVNARDTSVNEITADQQKANANDTRITAQIRKEIMKEKTFSTNAQNVKIITVNGKVTLKGPVSSLAEQNSILKHARAVAGSSNVVNEIAITR